MQHALLDFLRAPLVPELGADVAAGAARHVQRALVAVAAGGAFPHELVVAVGDDLDFARVAALLAAVALGVQLRVHDVVVDVPQQCHDCGDVLLHVRHFHVAHRAAGGELLELRLERELAECVDMLRDVHVVAVGDVVLVGHAGNLAEAALEALGELVRGAFERRSVEREVDVLLLAPFLARRVQPVHDFEREGRGGGVGVRLAGHVADALAQPRVAERDGRVAAEQQPVDFLALLQAGERAVLPQNRGNVGDRPHQAVVPRHERAVAQLKPLVEDFPEGFLVAAGRAGRVHEVYRHHALVEPPVELGLAVLVTVDGQEGAAAHARVAVAVLQLQHLLLADVVGDEPARGAGGGKFGEVVVRAVFLDVVRLQHVNQLGESGRDPVALLVAHTLPPLLEHLLDYHREVGLLPLVLRLVQVHEDRDERSLPVGRHERDHLVLNRLHAARDFVAQAHVNDCLCLLLGVGDARRLLHLVDFADEFLPAHVHEWREVRERDALPAVLRRGDLRDNLRGDVARRGEGVRAVDFRLADDRAVLEHVLKVDQIAVVHVLREVVRVVEVNQPLVVRLHDVLVKQETPGDVLGHLARHVVALHGDDHGVLVRVLLLDLLVVALKQAHNLAVRGIRAAHERVLVAVRDVDFGKVERAGLHQLLFHHVLNHLHAHLVVALLALAFDALGNLADFQDVQPAGARHLVVVVRVQNRRDDFLAVKEDFFAVAFDDFHVPSHPKKKNTISSVLCSCMILAIACLDKGLFAEIAAKGQDFFAAATPPPQS